jgi:hypothetical protein
MKDILNLSQSYFLLHNNDPHNNEGKAENNNDPHKILTLFASIKLPRTSATTGSVVHTNKNGEHLQCKKKNWGK